MAITRYQHFESDGVTPCHDCSSADVRIDPDGTLWFRFGGRDDSGWRQDPDLWIHKQLDAGRLRVMYSSAVMVPEGM